MFALFPQVRTFIERHAPYPFALQGVVTLALFMPPLSGLSLAAAVQPSTMPLAYWAMVALIGLHLIMTLTVPARRLPVWGQFIYLLLQSVMTAVAQAIFPTQTFDYVYLIIVLQSLTLFRPWLWIPFAIGVWAVWSGGIIIATASALTWLQSNLVLAFPATCAIIAAIIYMRQHRQSEQAQQVLQQVQQRYDSLSIALRDIQQRVALEERHRLAQLFTVEVQTTLARLEQSIAAALSQAQTNLSRLQLTITQTRDSAGLAVDRLRSAITILRRTEDDTSTPPYSPGMLLPFSTWSDELVIASQPYRILSWVLPIVFVALSLLMTLIQALPSSDFMPVLALYALLLLAYIYTQRAHNPLLLQIGLAGQTFAVMALAIMTQALPILLGLLLVLWQIALRLPISQIVLFFAGVPTLIGIFLVRTRPLALDNESFLIAMVAATAVAGPLLLARRQVEQRHQAELRAALLANEIEQQTAEKRALAVASERSRLAREFHDDLGSRLMLINLQLQLAEDLISESSDEALVQLQASRDQLHAAWRSVLAAADAELPLTGATLVTALTDLAAQCRQSTLVPVDLQLVPGLEESSSIVACTIYRAVQEGITNACKHARPSAISVEISIEAHTISVTISNDTSPVAPRHLTQPSQGSYGLIGLRERATALGGQFEAAPIPAGGFRLKLSVPYCREA